MFAIFMSVCIACYSIFMYISFIIKTAEWYFVDFIAAEFMVLTSDCFHLMVNLFIVEECFFIVSMHNTLFDDVLLDSFSSLSSFLVVFHIAVHLWSQTNEFTNRDSCGFIFKFTDYFFICLIKIRRAFRVVTVIELMFIFPKVLVYIFSFDFISQRVSVCE